MNPPPEPTPDEIAKWICSGANDARRGHPPSEDEAVPRPTGIFSWGSETAARFDGAKEAIKRADAKSNITIAAPLRRLRRDQGAVNESLIDAVRGLLAVVRRMGREIDSLGERVKDLELQLAEQRVPPPADPECE